MTDAELDEKLRTNGWEPCPFEESCITWIKPDDKVGLETHQRDWHPEQIEHPATPEHTASCGKCQDESGW